MKETKLTEPEKAGIYGKYARIKEESTKPVGYHLIGDMISDAQDTKTKRVIVEWLDKEARYLSAEKEVVFREDMAVLPVTQYQEFKKWALGE